MASQLSLVLLQRHFSLRENASFCLVLDSLRQSSHYLLSEFVHGSPGPVIYLSFETISQPSYAAHYLDCSTEKILTIQKFVHDHVSGPKLLVIIDSLNYVPSEEITTFISSIVLPTAMVIGTFHTNTPAPRKSGYPGAQSLLSYIAQAIFEVEPVKVIDDEELDNSIRHWHFPANQLNQSVFKLKLVNRRKSGRSLTYNYVIDSDKHHYENLKPEAEEVQQEDEEMLKGLTTFNLTTNSKQKLAREQVELPFMEAQTEMGKYGGAIVYEYEKDDDYDEEDPYEDPF